jgi:hypothetical protein
MFSSQGYGLYRSKREVFLWSMLGQALVVGLLAYFISDGLRGSPPTGGIRPRIKDLPLIFAGRGGGGGGNMRRLPRRSEPGPGRRWANRLPFLLSLCRTRCRGFPWNQP